MWFFWPKTVFPGLIVDKTVFDKTGQEHRSINWVLTHEKLVEPDGSQYDVQEDYYGFFPINRPEYVVRDLTIYDYQELDSLSQSLEWLYYSDTYGIYRNEWVYGREINERSPLVYGGLTDEAYQLYRQMYKNRKLTITEFNTLASPTPLELRFKMERMLEMSLTGWTGRYYHSLDTLLNRDIPRWMRRLHKRSYGRPFAYPDVPGIVLVHETNVIRVLRGDRHLAHPVPIINSPESTQKRFGVPQYLRYPYWFEITFPKDSNDVLANYKIHVTSRGDSLLDSLHLPNVFPAMMGDAQEGLRYYFCGDWADNPIPFGLAYFSGSQYLRKFFYNNRSRLDRKKFFWEYYLPTVTTIFEEYRRRMDTLKPTRPLPPLHRDFVGYYQRYGIPYPSVGVGTSYRDYDPTVILGSQFIDDSYRDSVLQVQLRKARESGYYVGELGDTVFLDQRAPYDTLERILRRNGQLNADSTLVRDSARDFEINARLEDYLRGGPGDSVKPAVKTPSKPTKKPTPEPKAPREASSRLSAGFFQRGARSGSGPAGQMSVVPAETDLALKSDAAQPESATKKPVSKKEAARPAGATTPENKPRQEESAQQIATQEKQVTETKAKEVPLTPTQTSSQKTAALSRDYFQVGGRVAHTVATKEQAETSTSSQPEVSQEKTPNATTAPKATLSTDEEQPSGGAYPTNLELPDRYRIVVGSFARPGDAVQLLQKLGVSGAMVVYIPKHDTYRVVHSSYASVYEADGPFGQVLNRYPQAWLVKF